MSDVTVTHIRNSPVHLVLIAQEGSEINLSRLDLCTFSTSSTCEFLMSFWNDPIIATMMLPLAFVVRSAVAGLVVYSIRMCGRPIWISGPHAYTRSTVVLCSNSGQLSLNHRWVLNKRASNSNKRPKNLNKRLARFGVRDNFCGGGESPKRLCLGLS